ncbi:MAG: T9SS type A sorting domain-containing protein, partial [Chitinophagaceae bacterium]|nr:T9SS type A sorting domain-containing protein [Chitinophagaceae bacterium]
KTNPTLTFSAVLNLTVGQKYVMTATSNSAAAISFTSSDVRIATVLGNTLTAVAVGTVTITAGQQANTQFNAASATRVVTIIAAPSVVIILDNNTIFEKLPPGSQIGILYASGLTNASFSTAHPSFRINGNALISNAEFNFLEGPRAYSLIISASGTNGTVSQVFFIETIRQVPYEQTLLSGVYVVGKDQTNYRIITLPYTNQTTAVFDALGGFDKTKWRLFDWNNGAYNEINTTTSLERGRGYFFLTSIDASMPLNPNGNTFTGSHLFKIPVTPGWNLLGNPYPFAMNWNAVSVSINGNKPTNVLIYDGAFQASTAVDIYQGFFVYMPSAGIVSIPLQAGFSFGMNTPSSQTARMSSNANNWQVQFTLANEQTTYTLSALGMSEGAEKGYDAEDLPTVPHFINKASIDFPHSEHFMKSFTKDIQPLSDNTTWDFIAEQSGYRVDFTLSWKIENIPQNELFLLDTKKGRFINMKEKNTYTLDLSSARAFRVYYGEKNFIESAYSNISPNVFDIYPNPTSDKISIPFFTPEEGYSLTLQVFDIHGKHVFSTIHNSSTKGNQTFHVETEKYMSHQGTYFSKMILEKGNTKKEVSQKIVKNEK